MAAWSGRGCIENSSGTIRKNSISAIPGKIFMAEYAKFIAHKNVKLGSAGQLEMVRKVVKK